MSNSYEQRKTDGARRGRRGGFDGLKPAFERLTDGLSTLVKEHLQLARHEVKQDVTTTGKRAAIVAACAVVALVGYIMLLVAAAAFAGWLGGWLAAWITAAAEAVVNLAIAAAMGLYFGDKLRDQKPVDLAQTNDELDRDKQWLREIGETNRDQKTPKPLSQSELPPS